jgi:NAD(P)-dependent dehydrogenase (short-subunit alcohol dehydrogenase family)
MLEGMDTVSVVLVTNVGQGFGRAIALSYGQAGFDVVCADKDVDLAAKTAAEIEELGGQAIPIQADMTTQMDVQNAFDKVFEIFGDLSGVVHVAAAESHTRFRDLSEGEFGELYVENLRSTFLTLKTAEKLLSNAWIVLVSPPKSATEPHMLALRGAITRMAAAFEARHAELRVNVVVPSRSASDPKHDARLVKTVRYLGSDDAEGLSGHRFYLDLPPPPRVIEAMLPEVRAALDSSVRQADLEASLDDSYEASEDDSSDLEVDVNEALPNERQITEDEETLEYDDLFGDRFS